MKFLFTADTHFGSAFRGENANIRNGELILTFRKLCQYASSQKISHVLIGGDIFDTPFPTKETQAAFIGCLKEFQDISFIMVAGNHDPLSQTAVYSLLPENAYVFPAELTKITVGSTNIYGASVRAAGDTRDPFASLRCDKSDIILTHGMTDGEGEFSLSSKTLADTGASLILAGHIHAGYDKLLTSGGRLIYSGALAGRGFDECGEKGFYEIDTDLQSIKFIPSGAKIYKEYTVDISNTCSTIELTALLQKIKPAENEIARVVLCGQLTEPYTIDTDALLGYFPCFQAIKDKSEIDVSITKSVSENTLEGKFLRLLEQQLDKAPDEKEKSKIRDAMKAGLIALRKK